MASSISQAHGRKRKFFKDFGIYSIGILGSKLITFLMVPLYTYFVERPDDYGYYDLCLTICLLLIPLVTLELRTGSFRFLLVAKDDDERSRIITFCYGTLIKSIAITVLAALAISLVCPIPYLWYSVAMLVIMAVCEIVAQTVRGLGNNKLFVANGLITTFGIGALSVILVAWLKLGIQGIFLANILARLISISFVESRMHTISRYLRRNGNLGKLGKEIIKFSLPMLPVQLCWTGTSTCERLFIIHFQGLDASGMYAVAVRFTSIIITLSAILYQTWQENAILQYHSEDRNVFFNKVFNAYVFALSALLIAYTFTLKWCYGWLVGASYRSSVQYLYPMGIAAVIYSLTTFFDVIYQCAKRTNREVPGVVLAFAVSLSLNFILVRFLGVYGVIISSFTSYAALLAYRWTDTRRFVAVKLAPNSFVPLLVAAASIVPFYCSTALWQDAIYLAVAFAIIYLATPTSVKASFKAIIGKLARRR